MRVFLYFVHLCTLIGCTSSTPDDLHGSWHLASINDTPLTVAVSIELEFDDKEQVSGSLGCNAMTGNVRFSKATIQLSNIIASTKGCENDLMSQEEQYHTALQEVNIWKIENQTLMLSGNSSKLTYTR